MRKPLNLSMRNTTLLVLCSIALLMASGCSRANYGAANISSEPAGAEIINLKDETNLGKTPAQVVWRGEAGSSEQVTIQLRKNGYQPAIASLWVNKRHSSEGEARANAVDVHAELQKEQ